MTIFHVLQNFVKERLHIVVGFFSKASLPAEAGKDRDVTTTKIIFNGVFFILYKRTAQPIVI